ncbi:hypothetical protein HDU97_003502 [Phlyctochytrium planicorne]|nr:hypothetical protein HDU97_003502 [Phlyctochytrium planicorne]
MGIKNKKQKIDQAEAEAAVQASTPELEKLVEIKEKIDQIDEDMDRKIEDLKKEADKQKVPLMKQRDQAVAKIPGFWSKVFLGHPYINAVVSEEEQEIIKHVKSFHMDTTDDDKVTFKFVFEKNDYFSNTELVYVFDEQTGESKTPQIKWGKDKSPIKGPAKETDSKKRKKTHVHDHGEECDHDHEESEFSFFGWLSGHETVDQEESLQFMQILTQDLYPNAVEHFMGEGDDIDEDEDDDEEDDE